MKSIFFNTFCQDDDQGYTMLSETDLEARQLKEAHANQLPLSASARLQQQLRQEPQVSPSVPQMPNEQDMREAARQDRPHQELQTIDPDEEKIMMEMDS